MLINFVTDASNQGEGWTLNYQAVYSTRTYHSSPQTPNPQLLLLTCVMARRA
jgi:hypothetical protein